MKFFIFFIICIAALIGCMATTPIRSEAIFNSLTKIYLQAQLENDMHPIIWTYLDKCLIVFETI